jgi:rod shape-determining protein MreD
MSNTFLTYSGIGIIFVLLQLLVFRHLEFWGIQTDVVLLYLFWLCTKTKRTNTLIITILLSLLSDILFDTWGLHLFSKTFIILLVHGYISRQMENILQPLQIFTLLIVICLVYNMVFLSVAVFAGMFSFESFFFKYWVGNSVYIAITGTFFYLLKPE